jgi:hypothetical protein
MVTYSICLEVSSVKKSSVAGDSSFVIRHSGREDTRSPVRNGASLRQSLIVSCNGCKCNRSARKSSHQIQNPLLLVTQNPQT